LTGVVGLALLFTYYGYRHSLPTPAGGVWGWFGDVFLFEYRNDVLGSLMVVPFLYATITIGWKKAAPVIATLLVGLLPYIIQLAYRPFVILTSISSIIVPPLLVASIQIKLNADARERQRVEEKIRERALVIGELLSAQEEERKRIALELHDGVCQTLLVTATLAHGLLKSPGKLEQSVDDGLRAIRDNVLGMVDEIRLVMQDLRPSVLDNLGLVSAIRWLVDNLRSASGVEVELALSGQTYEPAPDESLALFRVVQEALNNIEKHSGARFVRVGIEFGDQELRISIQDDGRGFTIADNFSPFALDGKSGLLGMNERVRAIGGRLLIRSDRGTGTRITVVIARQPPTVESTERGELLLDD